MVIYKTTNLINNKIYIGKNKGNNNWYLGSGKLLIYAIKKYGKENFKKEIIEICTSLEHMIEREIFWIEKLNARDRNIGYNIQIGGDGGDNYQYMSPEKLLKVKRKISDGVKLSIANGKKCVGFNTQSAKAAAKKLYEINKKDGFKSFTEKQNKTKIINGTHPGNLEMKNKNSEGVKKFWEDNPEIKKEMAKKISEKFKGKDKLSIFTEKYGEEIGKIKYLEFKEKLSNSKKGKIPWNKGIKQKEYEVKK